MKVVKISLLVLIVFSLVSGICYGQAAEDYYERGTNFLRKKMYDEAISAYKKTIEINPEYVKAHNDLGVAYYRKKIYDEAIAAYKKAVEINPEYVTAYYNLGLAYYYGKKMYDEAISAYKKAIEINPKYAKAHNNLAQAYYEKGEYSLAIEHLDRATELGYKVDPEFLERLEKAQKTLEQPIKPSQKTESFFSLSSPEDAVKSFLESSFLGDEETARKCWSKRVPDYLVSMTVAAMQKEIKKDVQEKAELIKLAIKTFGYERKWTGINSYYVWAIPPGQERSEDRQFKVVRENSEWKILAFKVWEKEDWFKALIEEE
jgi:tetratricopeptide (TPR) repeat protein